MSSTGNNVDAFDTLPPPEQCNALKEATHAKVDNQSIYMAIHNKKEENLVAVYHKVLEANAGVNPLVPADEARAVKARFTYCNMTCKWSTVDWQRAKF